MHPKIYRPINHNQKDSVIVYVEPIPETDNILYQYVGTDSAYAAYWSNNWRKTHGYPLKRKRLNQFQIYVKPVKASDI
jgi:hypothetical protein